MLHFSHGFFDEIISHNRYYEKVGNSEPKCIDAELPFDIPDNWCWTRLGNLIKINGGFAFKSENYVTKEQGIRVLRISDFDELGFNTKRPVYHKNSSALESFALEVDDIIMCMTGGTVGKSYFVKSLPEPMLVNQRVADIKINGIFNKDYIYFFILSPYIQNIINESKNSTNDNISIALINSFLIPIPPLLEQEQIVREIKRHEPLIVEYDKLEQEKSKLDSEIYDKLKKSILQNAIQGKLVPQDANDEPASELLKRIRKEKKAQLGKKYVDSYIYKGDDNCYYEHIEGKDKDELQTVPFDIPDSWCWVYLPQIAKFELGKTPDRHTDMFWNDGKYPWFSISDMKDRQTVFKTKEKISKVALNEKFNGTLVPQGTLLMSFKLTVGKTSILGIDAVHNEAIISIYPFISTTNVTRDFLLNTLGLLVSYVDQTDAIKGATLNSTKLKSMLIPLPPFAEQQRIVEKLNEIFAKL